MPSNAAHPASPIPVGAAHGLDGAAALGWDGVLQGGQTLALVRAADVNDATTAIALVRRNQTVLLNCSEVSPPQAQRLFDIVSGGVCAVDGQVRRLSAVLLLACPALASLEHL
ncbi:MAG: cell division protein SepF [Cyanobacteriota bacterium]|nr:cell division protein SepF [Cyanobacteriota bacterium]